MGILKSFLITGIAIFLLGFLFGAVTYTSWSVLAVASIVLTLLQKFIRPVLKILFLPINIITLGFFSWVINALILWLAIALVPGFHIDPIIIGGYAFGMWMSLFIASFVLGILQALVDIFI